MKKLLKPIAALLLALAMTLSMAACALTEEAPQATAAPAAEETTGLTSEERALVAARVGDYEVTKGEVYDQYAYMSSMYSYYGQALTADADIESLQDSVLNDLIYLKVMLHQAKLMGLDTLTEEELDKVQQDYESGQEELLSEFRTYAQEEGAEDVEARTVEMLDEAVAQNTEYESWDAYKEYMLQSITDSAIMTKVQDAVMAEVTITDEQVQAYYDDLVATQQEAYAAAPGDYLTAMETYEKQGGDPVLVTPEGYVRVKVISLEPEGEKSEEITTAETDMAALEAEYGKLALSGDAAAKARMTEIQTEYASILKNYTALYEAYIGDARANIDAAYAKLTEGADFDEVLAEYGDDPTYTTYEELGKKGRLMLLEGEDGWAAELHEAVKALAEGEHSAILTSGDAYYIVQLVSAEKSGVTPLSDVMDFVKEAALAQEQETVLNQRSDEWMADESLITRFEDVYRDIGKAN